MIEAIRRSGWVCQKGWKLGLECLAFTCRPSRGMIGSRKTCACTAEYLSPRAFYSVCTNLAEAMLQQCVLACFDLLLTALVKTPSGGNVHDEGDRFPYWVQGRKLFVSVGWGVGASRRDSLASPLYDRW